MQIDEQFYFLLTKQVSVADFEQWVYSTPELETVLSENDYLALISQNYKSRWAFHELQKLVSSYVNWSEMRRRELLKILSTIVDGGNPDDVLTALSTTFHLLCKGLYFFEELAHHGLMADDDFGWDPEGKWAKLTDKQKQQYIGRFYPAARRMAQQLIQQLESGQIQLHTQGQDSEVTYTETSKTAAAEAPKPVHRQTIWVKPWW